MTTLYPLLIFAFLLMTVGLFTHWSIILLGALLPFVPFVLIILRKRGKNPRR